MADSMNSLTKFKRKKLKTRKCLNELRKRLFSDSVQNISQDHNPACDTNDSEKYFKSKFNSITKSRLTLGFVHKAVLSETITRHALSTIRKKSGISNIFDKKKSIFDDHNFILAHSPTSDKSKLSFTEVLTASDRIKENFRKANRSNSPSLFSSLKSDITKKSSLEESESDSLENMHVTSLKSLDISQKMYEDFMECFSKYSTPNASDVTNEKLMKTPRVYLHNLDLQGHPNETEPNIARCSHNYRKSSANNHTEELSSEIKIEENPISYIKLGYTRQQAAPTEAASSTSRSRSNSPLPIPDTSTVSLVSLHDTPEYIFYPHRLNH